MSTDATSRTFDYDPTSGWVSSLVDNALSRTTTFDGRDAVGRVTQETLPGGRTVLFGYDANGNLSALTPPGETVHAFTSNAFDLTDTYAPPDLGFTPKDTTYTYNTDRQLTRESQPGGGYAVTYDSFGRLSTKSHPLGSVTWSYDTADRVHSIVTNDGVSTVNTWDGSMLTSAALTGPYSHTVNWTYNSFLRVLTHNIDGGNSVTYAFDNDQVLNAAGALTITRSTQNALLTGTTLGVVTDTYTYNTYGEVTDYSASTSGTQQYLVHYDITGGRITNKNDTVQGAATTASFTYDAAGRLYQVFRNGSPTPSDTYTYDANGNRLTHNADSGTYDAQDRMTAYAGTTYTYGPNGELASSTVGGATTTYVYDAFGNLRHVGLPSPAAAIDYVIDGKSRRVGKKVGGSLVQAFVYADAEGGQLIAELDGTGAIVSTFVYGGTRANVPDYMVKAGVNYRLVTDKLGSVRLVINATSGAVAQRLDYDEYGVVTNDTSPGFQPFGFAGGLYDRDTLLVRFGARDYDASTGRWTSKDRSRFDGGTNFYAYAGNDPIDYVDGTGYGPRLAAVGCVTAGTAGALLGAEVGIVATVPAGGAGVVPGAIIGGALGCIWGAAVGASQPDPPGASCHLHDAAVEGGGGNDDEECPLYDFEPGWPAEGGCIYKCANEETFRRPARAHGAEKFCDDVSKRKDAGKEF